MRVGKYVTEKRLREEYTLCDICGQPLSSGGWDASHATVEVMDGDVFPERDCRTHCYFDCCVSCFLLTVKPALEAIGIKFRQKCADDLNFDSILREE